MPHQCLNCGRLIERGSDEILKGCAECGGKKFMFTDAPMPERKREELKRRTDKVRDEMLRKADSELFRVLKERGVTDIGDSRLEMDSELGDDWVRYSPKEKGDEEEAISFEEGKGRSGTEVVGGDSKRSARALISQYDRSLEESEIFGNEKKKKREKKDARSSREIKESVRKKKKAPSKKKRAKAKGKRPPSKKAIRARLKEAKKKGEKKGEVDVINILEQGVYEIDLRALLEDNPIVIQKDGSYLLHLPSLFKTGKEDDEKL